MINVNELPALELDAGISSSNTDDAVTSVAGVVIGIVTGIIAGLTADSIAE